MFVIKHVKVISKHTYLLNVIQCRRKATLKDYYPVARCLGFDPLEYTQMLKYDPKLTKMSEKVLKEAVHSLLQIGFSKNDIVSYPCILHMPVNDIKNNVMLLQEFGWNPERIKPDVIIGLKEYEEKMIYLLRLYGFISKDTNIIHNVLKCLGIDFPADDVSLTLNERDTLKDVYIKILHYYMKRVLTVPYNKKWLKLTSFRIIHQNMYICKLMLNFDDKTILDHVGLLHEDPKYTMTLINGLSGVDFKKMLAKDRKFMKTSTDNLLSLKSNTEARGTSNNTSEAPSTLVIKDDSVRRRLAEILTIPQMQLFGKHPYCLSLIKNFCKAKERLLILDRLKIKMFTMRTLCCSDHEFIRFLINGMSKVSCHDVAVFISLLLGKNITAVLNEINKHPYINYIPIINVRQTFNLLHEMEYSNDDIFRSVQILLYPPDKVRFILQDLDNIMKTDENDIAIKLNENGKIPREFHLQLTLYFIERENNYTGIAIWSEETDFGLIDREETDATPIAVAC